MTARKPRLDVAAYRAELVAMRDGYLAQARQADLEHNHTVSSVRMAYAHGVDRAIEALDRQVAS